MPKAPKTAPEYRTPLPAHAVKEIAEDPKQRTYWENWQATGDAKLDLDTAILEAAKAEQAFIDCRVKSGMRATPGPVCGCGKHHPAYVKARAAIQPQSVKVLSAIERFKKGK